MHGYKRISRIARATEDAAIRDAEPHLARGRTCKIERIAPSKTGAKHGRPGPGYLAYVAATKRRRSLQAHGVGARLEMQPSPGRDGQRGALKFAYERKDD